MAIIGRQKRESRKPLPGQDLQDMRGMEYAGSRICVEHPANPGIVVNAGCRFPDMGIVQAGV